MQPTKLYDLISYFPIPTTNYTYFLGHHIIYLDILYIVVYLCINYFFKFIFNLFRFTIARPKDIGRYLEKYFFQIYTFIPHVILALIMSGDIEVNPGPESMHDKNISLCHWNLNGISANNKDLRGRYLCKSLIIDIPL